VRGYFKFLKLNYLPFEFFKRRFLLWQIKRRFSLIAEEDKAFEKYGMDDVIGSSIK
jgi:hypothetical protein